MSTRCQVKILNCFSDLTDIANTEGVLLYHHCDGYPSFMGPYLERVLDKASEYLIRVNKECWWDDERVAAMMVLLSSVDSSTPVLPWEVAGIDSSQDHIPSFQPSYVLHGDIEFLWVVILGEDDGEYDIKCFDLNKDEKVSIGKEIDWRAEI